MSIKCLVNGLDVDYPCSPVCALFGDCVSTFSAAQMAKVRTNADCIRAVSDEDLADYLDCPYHMEPDLCNSEQHCNDCILEWLKQPVKE